MFETTSTQAPGDPRPLLTAVRQHVDAAVTPGALVTIGRDVSSTLRQAETAVLLLAAAWADAHPLLEDGRRLWGSPGGSTEEEATGRGVFDEDRGIALWDPLTVSSFAASLGRSTTAGDVLLRDVAVLRHRLPSVWALAAAGAVDAWRARRVAKLVVGAPDEVCTHLDRVLAPLVATAGERLLERLLDEALLAHDPEQHEQAQLDKLAERHVTIDRDSITADGLCDIAIRADLKDAYDFDTALAQVAEALAALDTAAGREVEPLQVRRARAIGILADPEAAAELLTTPTPDDAAATDTEGAAGESAASAAPARRRLRKRMQLIVHLAADGYTWDPTGGGGWVPVAYDQTHHQMILTELAQQWAGRADTHLTITGVLDLADHRAVAGYRPDTTLRTQVKLKRATCYFPHCNRPAADCDDDHVVPYRHDTPEHGGRTCGCNLGPGCRRHHNAKTHGGWKVVALEDGTWLWADPHGQVFLVTPLGTHDLTGLLPKPGNPRPRQAAIPPRGCRYDDPQQARIPEPRAGPQLE